MKTMAAVLMAVCFLSVASGAQAKPIKCLSVGGCVSQPIKCLSVGCGKAKPIHCLKVGGCEAKPIKCLSVGCDDDERVLLSDLRA